MRSRSKKHDILQALKEEYPLYASGENLSKLLSISRTAVWKHIRDLQTEGYIIEASSRKGYRLVQKPQVFNGREIADALGVEIIGKKVVFF